VILIENLSRSWRGFSLKNINLRVEDGEYFVILGPTGAGKTLLLETIAGFHPPDQGRILINGVDVTNLPPERRGIGFVYQDYMLFPHMTVWENVEFGLKVRGVPSPERRRMVNEVLELVGLTHLQNRMPSTLSGGERQKTALARALVIRPRALLLDEPLSALDVNAQKRLRGELKRIHEQTGVTTIHVTHNQFEAYFLADRIAVMRAGSIVQVGSPDDVFRRPKDDFVARFVGFENLFEGRVVQRSGGISTIDLHGVRVEAVTQKTGRCVIGIRPDDIILSRAPIRSSMRNVLKGEVVDWIDVGPLINVIVKVDTLSFAVLITKRSFVEMNLKMGDKVYLAFKASSVHVI